MKTRDHYAALDGLRGIAAISVLFFHLGQWQQQPWMASNAGLAVDFFFALSGYVLCVAYGSKLDRDMSAWTFMKIRLIRLMPIIVLGTLISASYLIVRIVVLGDGIQLGEVLIALVLGSFTIPMLSASTVIGGPQVFPLNGPQYTLFLELVVNAIWAATRRIERLWTAIAVVLPCYAFTALYGFGGDTVDTFWHGFPRVLGAYYLGVVVFHLQQRMSPAVLERLGALFWPLLAVSLVMFYWPQHMPRSVSWIWSILVSPLIILTGSRVHLKGAVHTVAMKLGAISYPVYALHYPIFVWANAIYQTAIDKKDYVVGSALTVPLVLLGSWIILRAIDEPARKFLTAWTRGQVAQPSR